MEALGVSFVLDPHRMWPFGDQGGRQVDHRELVTQHGGTGGGGRRHRERALPRAGSPRHHHDLAVECNRCRMHSNQVRHSLHREEAQLRLEQVPGVR